VVQFAPVFLGALARRRVASLLSLVAIMLGVALGMGVQLIHNAALAEFDRGMRSLEGQADLQVLGPQAGFDEQVYATLATQPEVAQASPVLSLQVSLPGGVLTVLGLDIFPLPELSPALIPQLNPGEDRLRWLDEDALFLSSAARRLLDARPEAPVALTLAGRPGRWQLAGSLPGVAEGQALAVVDIAALQQRAGLLGRLSRVDLRLVEGQDVAEARARLQTLLPAGVQVEPPEAAQNEAARLSRAYRVNLSLLAAIALLTGAFLVFSAQALSVVRRRSEFAFLRAIGLSRRALLGWLLAEGGVLGLVGGLLGLALGYALAWGALQLLGGDLGAGYFAGLRPRLGFEPGVSALYLLAGILAGVAGAWLPAREAARVSPAQALKAGDEAALIQGAGHPRLAWACLLLAGPLCALPPLEDLSLGAYLAIALLLAGGVLMLPTLARALGRGLPAGRRVPVRLALARLRAAPGHGVIASAGVLTSVALAGAMAMMVASFRVSVDDWLTQILPADLYLRASHAQGSGHLEPSLQARIAATPGLAQVDFLRNERIRLSPGLPPVVLLARPVETAHLPLVASAPAPGDNTLPPIWISEAVQDLHGWQPGARVELPLAGSLMPVRVAGVWRDYARQTGAVLMDLADYRRLSGDLLANDAALHLAPGADLDQVEARLRTLAPAGSLELTRPGEIRRITLSIFDRTFAITYLLEAVAVAIGLAGVAASFAALAAARRREFGMLRHLGVSRAQVGWMLAQEGALAAGVGVLAGLLVGGGIGLILIRVVNRQSFHWSMDVHVPWLSLGVFGLSLIVLAALAAVLAGRQAMGTSPVLAVREDW
jgi:putative ABC transport system permease protein